MRELLFELLTFAIELIRQALEKEHPKNEFFEFRRIHLVAQDVGRLEEEILKLAESDFFVLQLRYLTFETVLLLAVIDRESIALAERLSTRHRKRGLEIK